MKRGMERFRGAREKGVIASVKCLGVSQEDTMESALWRKTLGKSLGLHDTVGFVGGIYHGNGCVHETIRFRAIPRTKTRLSSLTHNRVLHQERAGSLRESRVKLVVKDS